MGRHKEFDDATVVRAARDVFWQRGYASTSLADLQAATGLSRSSLYQTYGSKRALFDRAVESYCDEIVWPMVEPLEADGAGREELVEYFLVLGRHLRRSPRSHAARGCMIANTASELGVLDTEAARVVSEFRERVRSAILHALEGMADGFRDWDSKADLLTTAQFGLMINARLDPTGAAQLAETIAADVKTW
ncbi:TetR/AcrR family transcriptional regulator [Mycobacterium sp. Aquia_216]|uniref:TetR/AcrR family transcriptional regulator n=1 Tax=Mycobacterium sp. Aquia_216 TaxID=2991729 RepID=UPI00227B4E76|nr:TetR/AcrR family transcriptional regulator [Mycobacterium sp. Aquia_216]WAJ44296.1 TetR/AcrR family transcriptional regulator [Mycobacterium sp. Aquia_216]